MTVEAQADLYTRDLMALVEDTLSRIARLSRKLCTETTTTDRAMLTISSTTMMFIRMLAEAQQEAELATMEKLMRSRKK